MDSSTALIRYIRDKHSLLISQQSAEKVIIDLNAAPPSSEHATSKVLVYGSNLVTGQIAGIELPFTEVHEVLSAAHDRTASPLLARLESLWYAITKPRHDWLRYPLAIFLVTRLILVIGGYISVVAFTIPVEPSKPHLAPTNVFIDMWVRWDSIDYYNIATQGYTFMPGQSSTVVFFPGYPLLVKVVAHVTGNPLIAGLLISNVCLLGALIVLYRLTILEFQDTGIARRTVFYIAAFPLAFIFSAFYTESLFLLLTVLTMYLARRQRWWLAGLCGALATATRLTGIVLAASILLEWLRVQGWTLDRALSKEAWQKLKEALTHQVGSALAAFTVPLGLGGYMLYLYVRFRNPLAFVVAEYDWSGHEGHTPFAAIPIGIRNIFAINYKAPINPTWTEAFGLVLLVLTLLISVAVWRRLGASYGVYVLGSLILPLYSNTTGSIPRYILVLFPVMMMLGVWGRSEIIDRVISVTFCVLLGVLTGVFVNWLGIA